MRRERKILLALALSNAIAIAAVVALLTTIGAFKARAEQAQADAANWKRQAGKAYTEMLMARTGATTSTALIPAGSRIDCTMKTEVVNDRAISRCVDGTLYPPHDY